MLLVASGCPGRRPGASIPPAAPEAQPRRDAEIGLFRARAEAEGERRRFRLLVYAVAPDRLHAEAIAPVGGTVLILDGGPRRLSVAWIRDGVAYVGAPDPAAFERLLGVRVGLDDLVGALLEGRLPDRPQDAMDRGGEVRVERQGDPGRLPRRLVIEGPTGRLELERRDLRPAPTDTSGLGIGRPPDGFDVLPLDRMLERPLPEELRDPGRGPGAGAPDRARPLG